MRLRNGKHGYGAVTKTLHWLTVAALAGQFSVGYLMDADGDFRKADCDPRGEGRSGGDTTEAEQDLLDLREERCEAEQERLEAEAEDPLGTAWSGLGSGDLLADGLSLPEAHVLLGLTILAIAVLRVTWRAATPLPPWDPRLTALDRRILHWAERALLALLFLVPLTGLLLVVGAGDGQVALHVAAHLCFYAALATHVFVVVRRRVVGRMLPGSRGSATV